MKTKIETAVFEKLGAEFFPKIASVILIILGVLLIIEQGKKIDRSLLQFNWNRTRNVIKENIYSIFTIFAFVLYVIVLPLIGFIPSTILFLFISIIVLGKFRKKAFRAAIMAAVLIPTCIYYILEVKLRIILP